MICFGGEIRSSDIGLLAFVRSGLREVPIAMTFAHSLRKDVEVLRDV